MTRGRAEPAVVQLLSKTRFDTETGCWVWTAAVGGSGYSSFRTHGYSSGHRAAYELFVGPVPDGLHIDHLCRNTLCVNPDHLDVVTQGENNRRMWATRTHCPQGHPKTPENTTVRKSGTRECAECNRERARAVAQGRRDCHGTTVDCKRAPQCSKG